MNKATGSIEFNLRFAGQYYNSELHYNINRTYDPEVGRYMQSDPIGLSGGSNTYNYVNRNPLSNVAPLGLSKRDILKMREIFNISVKEMIQKDMMLPGDNSDTNYGFGDNNNEIAYSCNPLLKGQKSFLLSRECSEKDTKKTICYQQASYVHNKLIDNIKHFDDKWKIIQQSNNSHDWVVAIPLNPT